jgi:hypothetical protein
MRLMTKVFIAGQVMDAVTTFIALNFFEGFKEGNPIFNTPLSMVVAKIVVTVGVSLALEKYGGNTKLFWALPILTWFPVIWNTSLMIAYKILFG